MDFLDHLLVRLPIRSQHADVSKIKKHAQAFISLAARGKFHTPNIITNFVFFLHFYLSMENEVIKKIWKCQEVNASYTLKCKIHTDFRFLCCKWSYFFCFSAPSLIFILYWVPLQSCHVFYKIDWVIWFFCVAFSASQQNKKQNAMNFVQVMCTSKMLSRRLLSDGKKTKNISGEFRFISHQNDCGWWNKSTNNKQKKIPEHKL